MTCDPHGAEGGYQSTPKMGPAAELNWVHETLGLAETVVRPLFVDWVLRRGLTREFGPDYHDRLAEEVTFRRYSRDLALLYTKFGIQCR